MADGTKNVSEKRYKIPEVAKAIDRSEGAVRRYCEIKGIDPDEGLTIEQIGDVAFRRSPIDYQVDWKTVHILREKITSKQFIIADFSGMPFEGEEI